MAKKKTINRKPKKLMTAGELRAILKPMGDKEYVDLPGVSFNHASSSLTARQMESFLRGFHDDCPMIFVGDDLMENVPTTKGKFPPYSQRFAKPIIYGITGFKPANRANYDRACLEAQSLAAIARENWQYGFRHHVYRVFQGEAARWGGYSHVIEAAKKKAAKKKAT